jgi:hypothetical protein
MGQGCGYNKDTHEQSSSVQRNPERDYVRLFLSALEMIEEIISHQSTLDGRLKALKDIKFNRSRAKLGCSDAFLITW